VRKAKLEGLSEYDIRRPLTPTGTNLLGLINNPNLPGHDPAWWEDYRAQVERAARSAADSADGARA
jgi:hypothetical protein